MHGKQLWFCLGQVLDTQEEVSVRTSGVRKDGEIRIGGVRESKMEMSSREGGSDHSPRRSLRKGLHDV